LVKFEKGISDFSSKENLIVVSLETKCLAREGGGGVGHILTEQSTLMITGVKLMTLIAITAIPRWRTWNRVRIFFVD
jgi:hypothetical protein